MVRRAVGSAVCIQRLVAVTAHMQVVLATQGLIGAFGPSSLPAPQDRRSFEISQSGQNLHLAFSMPHLQDQPE